MNNMERKARTILEKYYKGETTLAEESFLMDYFLRPIVPDDLLADKELFVSLGNATTNPLFDLETEILRALEKVNIRQAKKPNKLFRIITTWATAASVAIVIGLSWYFTNDASPKTFADTFDDPYVAMRETQRVLALVGSKLSMAQAEMKPLQRFVLPTEVFKPVNELARNLKYLDKIKVIDKPKHLPFIKHIFENQTDEYYTN